MPPAPHAFAALPDLREMWLEMQRAPAIVQPSDFWTSLNDRNVRQLDEEGFAHFKRTINQNYFGWVPHTLGDHQLLAMVISWLRHPVPAVVSTRSTASPTDPPTSGRCPPARRPATTPA